MRLLERFEKLSQGGLPVALRAYPRSKGRSVLILSSVAVTLPCKWTSVFTASMGHLPSSWLGVMPHAFSSSPSMPTKLYSAQNWGRGGA